MIKIDPIKTLKNAKSFVSASPASQKNINYYHSTIRSEKKEGCGSKIYRVISAPFQFVCWLFSATMGLLRTIFCFSCRDRGNRSVDWKEIKDPFDKIYTAVFLSEHGSYSSDRQKLFNRAFRELSEAGQEKFREHIGRILAKRQNPSIDDQQAQIKWYKEHRDSIDFHRDYFSNISDNVVLQQAVKAFQEEIDENTQ